MYKAESPGSPSARRPLVLVAGGGVAGIEALLALRELAADRLDLRLLEPQTRFAYRPMAAAKPFAATSVDGFLDLATLVSDLSLVHHRDDLRRVDATTATAVTTSGTEIPYDALLVCAGARMERPLAGVLTFMGPAQCDEVRRLLTDLRVGTVKDVAFTVPAGVSWALPLYELALMTAEYVTVNEISGVRLSLTTHEQSALAMFGRSASEAITALFEEHGVGLYTGCYPTGYFGGTLTLLPRTENLHPDRVVTLPRLIGPAIEGLPHDASGFIPTDLHGRVRGIENVYAAGDVTSFPIKQGGIATQQADAAAETIAAAFGAPVEPAPFRPVLRGMLLTGSTQRFMRTDIAGGEGEQAAISTNPLWWPPGKIAGRFLAPYLARRAGTAQVSPPPLKGAVPVEVELSSPSQ